jgi:SAM-dependent methyltransferase
MNSAEQLSMETVYTEERTPIHDEITEHMVKQFIPMVLKEVENPLILDFGCGTGVAWDHFPLTCYLVAITPNPEEGKIARSRGIPSYFSLKAMEQIYAEKDHPMEFDAIWARHSMEHVISPFETLLTFKQILKDGGLIYIEVPSPDTVCLHEANPNHYSVLGDRMWQSLFEKVGFETVAIGQLDLTTMAGPDKYFWYILRK